MYIPKHFEETNLAVLHALIRAHPLGCWVSSANGELFANHIPFLLDASQGELGTLVGHVARANDAWKSFDTQRQSLLIFQGPEAYITPSWYPSKRAHGKAVPTWNFAVVHARGLPRVVEEHNWLLNHVTRLTATHEANEASPWKVADAPRDYIDRMLGAIVGIEIPIAGLTGKWKVSQNRPDDDRTGVVAGLTARNSAASLDMASLVELYSRTP